MAAGRWGCLHWNSILSHFMALLALSLSIQLSFVIEHHFKLPLLRLLSCNKKDAVHHPL